MIPVKSNTPDPGCSPVSSNCVVWQGPALSCISLCTGDTISSVVYKLATELCNLQQTAGLSDLDLTCLVNVCQATPEPEKTLAGVLDLLINKVCCLADIVSNLPTPGSEYVEPVLNLPACLQYTNEQGQTITSLVHSQYTLTLATKICAINTLVNQHTSQISSIDNRVTVLENAPGITLPTVTPNCVLTPGVATAMDQVLDELEKQFCQLKTVLGSNTSITSAAAQQCAVLGSSPAFSQAGTLSSYPGWNPVVTNLAQSFQNLWITVCDMRGVIQSLKDCCGQADCSSFLLGFTAAANEDRSQVTLFFTGSTVVPPGFTNCVVTGSKVTIADTSGHVYTAYVDLLTAQSDVDGIPFTVSGASLNPGQPYTITVEGCVTKDGKTCSKTATYTVAVPCPVITSVTATLE